MESASRQEIECPLSSAARECPDEPAVISPDRTVTFHELDRAVTAMAAQLTAFSGRRIASLLDPGTNYLTLVLAAIRAGVTLCPISTRLPKAAVKTLVEKVEAAALVSDRSSFANGIDPRDLLRSSPAATSPAVVDLALPATVVFTSGSTGSAKAALHTFGNHYYSAEGSNQNIPVGVGDRWLLALPLYHVGGLAVLFRCILGRAAVFIPHPGAPMHEAIAKVTHASMVATQLRRLLGSESRPDLKALLLGGSAIPDSLIVEAHRRDLPIHTSYGLTEMASQVATTSRGASLDALRTSGSVLPYREVRIDTDGEILVRGRTLFAGYLDGDDLSRPFDGEGWFATGDLGYIGDDDLLRVRGRKDNMFISGGENIIPEEIEDALTSIPGVAEAVVVPVEEEEFGHRPVAFLRMTGATLDADALRENIKETLPRYMVPIAFYPWPDAQAETSLKVDRNSMRRKAEALRSA